MTTAIGTFSENFSTVICPFCWQTVGAMAAVIEPAREHVLDEGIIAKGPDKLVGADLLPCGHRVTRYFWLVVNEESVTIVMQP